MFGMIGTRRSHAPATEVDPATWFTDAADRGGAEGGGSEKPKREPRRPKEERQDREEVRQEREELREDREEVRERSPVVEDIQPDWNGPLPSFLSVGAA